MELIENKKFIRCNKSHTTKTRNSFKSLFLRFLCEEQLAKQFVAKRRRVYLSYVSICTTEKMKQTDTKWIPYGNLGDGQIKMPYL